MFSAYRVHLRVLVTGALVLFSAPGWANDQLTETLQKQIRLHGPLPGTAQPTDAGNPLSGNRLAQKIGQHLFNDARLSGSQKIACASCHIASRGFTDGRPRAIGMQSHTRNTQGLLDVARQRWFGWDGGADSLWSASLRPMLSPLEMGGSIVGIAQALNRDERFVTARPQLSAIAGASQWEAPTSEKTVVLAAKSIAAYLTTLHSPRTPFDALRDALVANETTALDRYPRNALAGLKLFFGKAKCHVCHYGPNFSNGEFHDIGRPFIPSPGQIDPGRYGGITRVRNDRYNLAGKFATQPAQPVPAQRLRQDQTHWGQWRTPSLRNLSLTAPYMHDGSLQTLRDVVNWYADIDVGRLHSNGETILQPLNLSNEERESLVAFLKTLSPSK